MKGRRPLAKDAELDYEVMSDEEWEEEPEGENLSVSLIILSDTFENPCLPVFSSTILYDPTLDGTSGFAIRRSFCMLGTTACRV